MEYKKYKILKILHNGRKGIRGNPVTDIKYDGLINADVYIENLDDIVKFQCLHINIIGHSTYNWWDTTEVITMSYNPINRKYYIETINTIYILQELDY